MCTAASIRRRDHPRRPSAITCSLLSLLKTLLTLTEVFLTSESMSRIRLPIGRFSGDCHWPVLGNSRGSPYRPIGTRRHRDLTFKVDDPNAPVSIIITTLAALAYGNQLDIQEALHAILSSMDGYIAYENGRWCIPNPSEPNENFADKWNEEPDRRVAFFWLEKARKDFTRAAEQKSLGDTAKVLSKAPGRAEAERAVARLSVALPGGISFDPNRAAALLQPDSRSPVKFFVPSSDTGDPPSCLVA